MIAYAAKKGHEDAFMTDYKLDMDPTTWTADDKANKVLMEAAWTQIALFVQGHALKSVMKVKSLDPKEAWDRLS